MSIKLLDKDVINQISAGEVVEKPASIVKELVENSIDAGATQITIEIQGGGIERIAVTDNGCGINRDEIMLAFMPHATSKLRNYEDLNSLDTMGFRGEALASISAVSKVSLITKTASDDTGIMVKIISGKETERTEVATVTGTKIEVTDVFYNTPARLKFLRKPKSEESDITGYVEKLILSNSSISFKYIVDGKLIYNTITGTVFDNIYAIYGRDVAESLIEVNYEIGGYKIYGYISKPEFCKPNRTYQNLFVNSRFCSNSLVSVAVSYAYENFTMKGKFPLFVLFINLPQQDLDVNVHPNKLEVKFTDTQKIYKLVNDGVFKALSDYNHVRSVDMSEKSEPLQASKVNYTEIDKSEGVSFSSSNEEVVETRSMSDYFKNNRNDGSYGFRSSNDILFNPFKDVRQKREMQEISLSEVEIKPVEVKNDATTIHQEKISALNIFENSYRVVGKLFNTYLILEHDNSVYLIDQHAGHERIKYDLLIKQIEEGGLEKQDLLFPYSFTVSANEYNFLTENLDLLNEFGIEISEFGVNTFKISSVPVIVSDINLKSFINELLTNINGYAKSPKNMLKEKFMQIACKSAVKGGDDLKDIEIKSLLNQLKETKVLLCPHGRPIVVEITQKQIEKWFKRIV